MRWRVNHERATYQKPYKIAVFLRDEPNALSRFSSDYWSELTLDSHADYRVNRDDFQSANVVACLSRKSGTEVKSLTCDMEADPGEHVAVDFYAVQYNIELREARTGKRIEQLEAVNGPVARCPVLAWVNKRDQKAYAEPDRAVVDARLAEFAHR